MLWQQIPTPTLVVLILSVINDIRGVNIDPLDVA